MYRQGVAGIETNSLREAQGMKKSQLYLAAFWVALGLFVCLYTYRLGLGQVTNPGPGLYPFCVGVVFLALACGILAQTLFKTVRQEKEKDEQSPDLRKVVIAVIVLFAYAFLLEALGYLLVTFVVLAVLFRLGGYNKVTPIVGYSLATVIVSYLLFTYLGVQFPPGVFRLLTL